MNNDFSLHGKMVDLKAFTKDLWHEYYMNYEADIMMDNNSYKYNMESVENGYIAKMNDATRLYFSINHCSKVVGQIYLKHIDKIEKSTEFGIALINDSEKGKSYGTEAIKMLCDYTFGTLGLECITANTVLGNTRSQHVLEKVGFKYTHEDVDLKYYKLEKTNN